jgi:predicted glutamine amidotransferase
MCELLGISCSEKARPTPYFEAFRKRGKKFRQGAGNPDGWGIACYPDGKALQLIKESIPASKSKLAWFLATYEHLSSKVFIAHVRKASRGEVTYSNSHPFSRELRGIEYSYAHNGTIRSFRGLRPGRFKPIGDTDSERLFCLILKFIRERRTIDWNEDDFIEFWKFLVGINRMILKGQERPNKINLLLSDGETLIAYSDLYGRGVLHRLLLREYGESLADGNGSSEHHQINDGTAKSIGVVATKPVSGSKLWVSMEPGELCAMRNGVLVFSTGKAAAR